MVTLQTILGSIAEGARRIAPYLLTELLLPGGTILAVLLFLVRRRRARLKRASRCPVHHRCRMRNEPRDTAEVTRAA